MAGGGGREAEGVSVFLLRRECIPVIAYRYLISENLFTIGGLFDFKSIKTQISNIKMKFQYKKYAKAILQIFKFEPVKFCKSNNRLKNSQPVSQSPLRVRQTHTKAPKTKDHREGIVVHTADCERRRLSSRHSARALSSCDLRPSPTPGCHPQIRCNNVCVPDRKAGHPQPVHPVEACGHQRCLPTPHGLLHHPRRHPVLNYAWR